MSLSTPDVYRHDITRTQEALARTHDALTQLDQQGVPPEDAAQLALERQRWLLVSQLEDLERARARAAGLWAQAQAQGTGRRLP